MASTSQEAQGWLGVRFEAATMKAEEAEEKAEVATEAASEETTKVATRTLPKNEGS